MDVAKKNVDEGSVQFVLCKVVCVIPKEDAAKGGS